MARFATTSDRDVVRTFAGFVQGNRYATLTELEARAPSGWRRDEDGAARQFAAFLLGFDRTG